MAKVWKMDDPNIPADAVRVDRTTKWGNPYRISPRLNRIACIAEYRRYLMASPHLIEDAKRELKGKDLVCWCSPKPCHADVLLEIANG